MSGKQNQSSNNGSGVSSNIDWISLNNYIRDNSSLFLVMGVFAALSVYISSVPADGVDDQFIQLGLVTSLLITGLVAVVILSSISNQVSESSDVMTSLFHIKNIDTIIFITLFITLFYSLFQIITEEIEVLSVVAVVVLFAGIFAFMLSLIRYTSLILRPYIPQHEFRSTVTATVLFIVFYYTMMNVNDYLYDEYQLHQFQFHNDLNLTDVFPVILYFALSLLIEIIGVASIIVGVFALAFTVITLSDLFRKLISVLLNH